MIHLKTHMPNLMVIITVTILAAVLLLCEGVVLAPMAFAHGAERGLVMLLPTHFYMIGAAIAVALSCLLLASAALSKALASAFSRQIVLFKVKRSIAIIPSLLSFLVMIALIYSGFYGSPDPLSNLLPLTIWTGWWVGFTLIQVIVGDLWRFLNPWSGITTALTKMNSHLFPKCGWIMLPKALGYSPAVVFFAAFAWFELISIAPEDPQRLARAVLTYWLINFIAIVTFGQGEWLLRGEPFAVFYRLLGRFSPLARSAQKGVETVSLSMPGAYYVKAAPLPFSAICLLLLVLGSASFDGLAETFAWMGLWGINPLEYSGRSSVTLINSIGLFATPIVLGAAFYAALHLGFLLSGGGQGLSQFAGRIIYSIIPIAIAFHAAHYLTLLLINGQYLLKALSDPFHLGWDIFGTADLHVTASMVQNIDSVGVIWTAQVAIITLGHMAGITLAHLIAMDRFKSHRLAARSQLPLAGLMVFYTVFGLWLLSTPTIG